MTQQYPDKMYNEIIKSRAHNLIALCKFTDLLKLKQHFQTDTYKTQGSCCHFVNNRILLGHSLSITEKIVDSVANQRTAFVIER